MTSLQLSLSVSAGAGGPLSTWWDHPDLPRVTRHTNTAWALRYTKLWVWAM